MADDSGDTLPLLRRAAGGDAEALAALWARHRDRLGRMVHLRLDRRLHGRLDPSDVLQEAFVDFALRAGEFNEQTPVPFFIWLRALTGQRLAALHRRHLGARMRDAGREISLHRGDMPEASGVSLAGQILGRLTTASRAFERAELRAAVEEALDRMDPVDREILALRHFEELSNAEAAEVLGLNPSTASTRHIRAMRRLRQALEAIPGLLDGEAR